MKQIKKKLSERMLTFLELELSHLKPSTVATYQIDLRHFQDFLCDIFHTNAIHKEHIAALQESDLKCYMACLNRKQLAPFTKLQYLICARKYLRWEAHNGIINEDRLEVLDNSHLPKIPQYLPKPLSLETDRILQNKLRQSNSSYAPLFLLLRLTGLRISELINLPWDCVITNFKNEHYLKVPIGKLDNERLVPLNHEAIQLIQKIKDCYPIKKGKCDKTRLIGLKGDGSTYVYSLLRHQFKKILGSLITDQGKPITFHRLRHSYATSLLTGGVSIVSIMKLLGHKRIEMSLRYAKVSPSHLRNEYLTAMNVLEKNWTTKQILIPNNTCQSIEPACLLSQLRAFTDKSVILDNQPKKILLRRLARLQNYLASITFSQKFKLLP